jgi:GPI-anchor transamidase subunit S
MEPQPLPAFQQARMRRLLMGVYLAVIILAIPLWWSLTSIERLSLPATQVNALADHKVRIST